MNHQTKLVHPKDVRVELRELQEQAKIKNYFFIRGMGITFLEVIREKFSEQVSLIEGHWTLRSSSNR